MVSSESGLADNVRIVIYVDPDTNRTYTYAQVRYTALEFGKGLKAQWDWKKGDVLAIYSPNCIDTPAITWGCSWAGGILSPANPGYTPEELAFQLKDSGARALVTQKVYLEPARKAAKLAGIGEDMIILMGDEKDGPRGAKHFSGIRNLEGTRRFRKTKVDPKKDLAFLVYSSGTTGELMRIPEMLGRLLICDRTSKGRYAVPSEYCLEYPHDKSWRRWEHKLERWKEQRGRQDHCFLAILPHLRTFLPPPLVQSATRFHTYLQANTISGSHLSNTPIDLQRPRTDRNAPLRP